VRLHGSSMHRLRPPSRVWGLLCFSGLAAACALLAGIGAKATTGEPAADATPQTVTVRFQAQATAVDGATGVPRVRARRDTMVGGKVAARFAAGTSARPDLCDLRTFDVQDSSDSLVHWEVSATVLGVSGSTVRLSVEWTRNAPASIGTAGSRTREIHLRAGQSHVFDAVLPPPSGASGCANVLLSVEAETTDTVGTGDVLLAYALRLTHERFGILSTAALELIGSPAEPLAFRFRPLRVPVGAPGAEAPAVEMDVLGTVTVRGTSEGEVALSIAVSRRLVFGGTSTGSGEMQFLVKFGEEVEIELPRPVASSWLPVLWTGPTAAGVDVERHGLRVDYASFFAGDSTSVLVKVDRIR
jgi:hypothetical protein